MRPPVPKRLMLVTVFCLAATVALCAATLCGADANLASQQDPSPTGPADQPSSVKENATESAARKKGTPRFTTAKKNADRSRTAKKKMDRASGLVMEPGIVCKSIDGYEDYKRLPGAAQTSDEKLLVYIRTHGFQTEKVDKAVEGHLVADGEVRRHGQKAILRQKKSMLDYRPRAAVTPERVYLKASVSLKGLVPGDYDLTVILHDEIAKDISVSQVIKFKVIPPKDPRNEPVARQPHELDTLYAPFVFGFEPEDDE
jgi:hypothetical protein